MDYIKVYLPYTIAVDVYSYMNWYDIRNTKGVPDIIWKRICEHFAKYNQFIREINTYWNKKTYKAETYKNLFLQYINHIISEFSRPTTIIPNILLLDEDFIVAASKHDALILYKIKKELLSNYNLAWRLVDVNSNNFIHLNDPIIRKDYNITLKAVKRDWKLLDRADYSFRYNRKIAFEAVKQNKKALEFVSETLRGDRQFMLSVAKLGYNVKYYLTGKLKGDPEFDKYEDWMLD